MKHTCAKLMVVILMVQLLILCLLPTVETYYEDKDEHYRETEYSLSGEILTMRSVELKYRNQIKSYKQNGYKSTDQTIQKWDKISSNAQLSGFLLVLLLLGTGVALAVGCISELNRKGVAIGLFLGSLAAGLAPLLGAAWLEKLNRLLDDDRIQAGTCTYGYVLTALAAISLVLLFVELGKKSDADAGRYAVMPPVYETKPTAESFGASVYETKRTSEGFGAPAHETGRAAERVSAPASTVAPVVSTLPGAAGSPASGGFCSQCGAPLVEGAVFCSECGAPLPGR